MLKYIGMKNVVFLEVILKQYDVHCMSHEKTFPLSH